MQDVDCVAELGHVDHSIRSARIVGAYLPDRLGKTKQLLGALRLLSDLRLVQGEPGSLPNGGRERRKPLVALTEGCQKPERQMPGQSLSDLGVPNARTLFSDRFDLVRDPRDRRLRREEDQAARHWFDPCIGIDREDRPKRTDHLAFEVLRIGVFLSELIS